MRETFGGRGAVSLQSGWSLSVSPSDWSLALLLGRLIMKVGMAVAITAPPMGGRISDLEDTCVGAESGT